jgi:hypothetical protein
LSTNVSRVNSAQTQATVTATVGYVSIDQAETTQPETVAGTQFTGFTSTKVQILTQQEQTNKTPAELLTKAERKSIKNAQFTCFTGTKVQILTLHAYRRTRPPRTPHQS